MNRLTPLVLILALAPFLARAHDPGLSAATVDLDSRSVLVQMSFAPADLRSLSPEPLEKIAAASIELNSPSGVVRAGSVEVREAGADYVEFILRFPRAGSALSFRSALLQRLAFGHRQALTVRDSAGATTLTELLSAAHDSVPLPGDGRGAGFPLRERTIEPLRAPWLTIFAGTCIACGAAWLFRRRSRERFLGA